MKPFNEGQLNKLLKAAIEGAVREFQAQNKDVKVTNLQASHDFLYAGTPVPTGMSYHITADVVTIYPTEAIKEEDPK